MEPGNEEDTISALTKQHTQFVGSLQSRLAKLEVMSGLYFFFKSLNMLPLLICISRWETRLLIEGSKSMFIDLIKCSPIISQCHPKFLPSIFCIQYTSLYDLTSTF